MDDITHRIKKALRSFSIEEIYISDFELHIADKSVVVFIIVTDSFDCIRPMTRYKIVEDVIKSKEPELYNQYVIAYECYTKDEHKMIKLKGKYRH